MDLDKAAEDNDMNKVPSLPFDVLDQDTETSL